MILSMTGFASLQGARGPWSWAWDIRSVNGKGLDLRLKLPDWIEGLEQPVRKTLAEAITRGNVSVGLRLARETEAGWAGAPDAADMVRLPSHEEIEQDPKQLMTATLALERQVHQGRRWAVQCAGGRQVVLTPPAAPLTTTELDALYALPYTRRPHPAYTEPVPAAQMIQFSMTAHRGCAVMLN